MEKGKLQENSRYGATLADELLKGSRGHFLGAIERQLDAITDLRDAASMSQEAATISRAVLTAAAALARDDELRTNGLQAMRELELDAFRRGRESGLAMAADYAYSTGLVAKEETRDQLARAIRELKP